MMPTELSSEFGTIDFCNRYDMDFGICMLLSLSTVLYMRWILEHACFCHYPLSYIYISFNTFNHTKPMFVRRQ